MKTLRSQLLFWGFLLVLLPALLLGNFFFHGIQQTGESVPDVQMSVALAGAAGLVLLGVLLILGGFYWVIVPIRQLTEAARAIREGNFDYQMEARAQSKGPLEVRELFYTFARMAEKINMQIRSLEKANAVLAQEEERWQLALQGNKDGIWDWNVLTNESFQSERCREMLGFEAGEGPATRDEFMATVHPEDLPAVTQKLSEHLQRLTPNYEAEYRCLSKDGQYKWVLDRGQALWNERGVPIRMAGSLTDISERKQMEEKLINISLRDSLTGLYNRAYFQEELRRLNDGRYAPLAVIVCDVDGLKLYNDSFGHLLGDRLLKKAAELLTKTFRAGDVVARIGGDEFAILLSRISRETVEKALVRLQDSIDADNEKNDEFLLSISTGVAYSFSKNANLTQLFREADNNMYREKNKRSLQIRESITRNVVRVMEQRDFFAEGHTQRVTDLCLHLAEELGLPEERVQLLRLLAQYHDLGKVGIPDKILFKQGSLNDLELQEVQRHSEIGHRIALSVNEARPIAEWILKHQEWWDGQGYPLGISGDDIPLECRILAIADAYDAMTSDRPYRSAVSHEEALRELRRCSGTQFDPFLVNLFCKSDPRRWGRKVG